MNEWCIITSNFVPLHLSKSKQLTGKWIIQHIWFIKYMHVYILFGITALSLSNIHRTYIHTQTLSPFTNLSSLTERHNIPSCVFSPQSWIGGKDWRSKLGPYSLWSLKTLKWCLKIPWNLLSIDNIYVMEEKNMNRACTEHKCIACIYF